MRAKKTDEMTEIELQRSIAENMRTSIRLQRSTNGWITFMGVLQLVSLIGVLIVATS